MSYLSSIRAASHWFIQTNCLHDYQLWLKRFMIVTVTSLESNILHLADFERATIFIGLYNPRASAVKWTLLMSVIEFQQQPASPCIFVMKKIHSEEYRPYILSSEISTMTSDTRPTYRPVRWHLCTYEDLCGNTTGDSDIMTWNSISFILYFYISNKSWWLSMIFHSKLDQKMPSPADGQGAFMWGNTWMKRGSNAASWTLV